MQLFNDLRLRIANFKNFAKCDISHSTSKMEYQIEFIFFKKEIRLEPF